MMPFTSVVTAAGAAGSVASTPEDLVRWAQGALRRERARADDPRRDARRRGRDRRAQGDAPVRPRRPVGRHRRPARRSVTRAGCSGSARSSAGCPSEGIAIAVLTNQSRTDPGPDRRLAAAPRADAGRRAAARSRPRPPGRGSRAPSRPTDAGRARTTGCGRGYDRMRSHAGARPAVWPHASRGLDVDPSRCLHRWGDRQRDRGGCRAPADPDRARPGADRHRRLLGLARRRGPADGQHGDDPDRRPADRGRRRGPVDRGPRVLPPDQPGRRPVPDRRRPADPAGLRSGSRPDPSERRVRAPPRRPARPRRRLERHRGHVPVRVREPLQRGTRDRGPHARVLLPGGGHGRAPRPGAGPRSRRVDRRPHPGRRRRSPP